MPPENEEIIEDTTGEKMESPAASEGGELTSSLLDAINAALEPTLPKTEEVPTKETDENADNTSGSENSLANDAEDEDTESEETGEGDKPRGPDGKFLKAGETGKAADGAAKPGDAKLGPDGKPVAEPKKADPVNDPIPEEIKGRTRERMTALIDTVKAKDAVIQNQDTVISAVRATGATPEEFAAMVSYMGWVRSDDAKNLTNARDMLLRELEAVSLKLGEAAPGVDFVSKHPDLKSMVEAGQITQEAAQELAISRTRTQKETATAASTREAEEATQRATTERNSAIKELDTLGQKLAVEDPDFAAKHAIIEPMLESLGMLPPNQWRAAFERAYKNAGVLLQKQRASGAVAKPAGDPVAGSTGQQKGGTPLRANKGAPSGSQVRQPTSLLDAVSAAIDSVGNG